MAFTSANRLGNGSSALGNSKLDASQIGKLEEAGYNTTTVSNNPEQFLVGTTPTTKQTVTGATVPGFQANDGRFFVVDENNSVKNVTFTGTDVTPGQPESRPPILPPSFDTKPLGDFSDRTPVLPGPPIGSPPIPNQPPLIPPPAPPSNLGSGKIFSRFESGDVVPNQQETVTRALWSNSVANLLTFYTSSAQTSTSKRYYYEIYNSASSDCGTQPQFSIAYGHKWGSGSADEGGQINDTPSRAIYGQYKQLCLEPDEQRFIIGGNATDSIYVLNVNRARMRESLDEGNIEINLQRLSGSQWLSGGGAQNAWTGSNVRVFPTQAVTRLVDDSRVSSATVTSAGEVYNVVSGTLEDGIYNSSAPHYYGLLYRRLGIIVLDGNKLDQSASFLTVTGSEVPGNNAFKALLSISGAAKYTDASGDYLGFQGRSSEKVKSSHYFVRVRNQEYNFSNNPTFTTGSEGDLAEPTFIGDPQIYLTTVGLYNDGKELVAVAKLSKPIKKNFNTEALIKVKLEF